MFDFLRDAISQIGDFLSGVWDFLNLVVDEIAQFFRIVKPAVSFFTTLLVSLPPVFVGFGVAMIAVLIVYVILGRNAGGD